MMITLCCNYIPFCLKDCKRMDFIEEFIDFLIGASEQTRQHVDAVIKEAISCSVKVFMSSTYKNKI